MLLKDYPHTLGAAALKVGMPDAVLLELQDEWNAFCKEHAEEDYEEVELEYDLHMSRLGGVTVIITPEKDELQVAVQVVELEEDADGGLEEGEVKRVDPLEHPEVWEACNPTEQLKAEPRVPPNAKCPCGSGKKFKKCCGKQAA